MKKSVMTCALMMLVCLGFTSAAQAVLVTSSQQWFKSLDVNESLTCIAYYVWGSVEFTQAPEWVHDYDPVYNHDIVGWNLGLSEDRRTAYIYGPSATNSSTEPREWFAFELFYQWDDEAPDFDPAYPVYQDIVLFDGPLGSAPTFAVGRRGTPGDAGSWEYNEGDPDSGPYQTDEPYENPIPGPATICLLGLGAAFLRRKVRKRR